MNTLRKTLLMLTIASGLSWLLTGRETPGLVGAALAAAWITLWVAEGYRGKG